MSVNDVSVKLPRMRWQNSYVGISEEYSIELPINTVDTQSEEYLFIFIDGDSAE